MANKQRLELTWIGKNNPEYDIANIEPRILEENPDLSNCEDDPGTENMLIHGDNLLALRALLPEYEGKIKCVYIDPPYNTGNAFEHYDDSVEHSTWLSLMKPRLELLRMLLMDSGSIWINLDDNETHYCKVMCDEVFGRNNFLANVVWEKADSPNMDSKFFSSRHDNILVYAKNIDVVGINRILNGNEIPSHYNKKDENGEIYYLKPLRAMGVDGYREKRPSMYFPVIAPDGTEVYPKNPDGSDSRWRWSSERVEQDKQRLEWVKTKKGWSLYFRIYLKDSTGTPPETIWHHQEVGTNRTSKKEIKDLFPDNIFGTPKPESLISRIVALGSNSKDLILDSFLGSGTTTAVAHKMGRRWIGIEMGDHAYTHCKTRLDKVVDGLDNGGISKAVGWNGGGAYKFYELAPSFIAKDEFSNPIIDGFYNDEKLIKAMCKLMNFSYEPSKTEYWKQGIGQGKNYLYVTTQLLTCGMIQQIAAHLSEGESLIVCPKKFEPGAEKIDGRVTIKKIPQSVLKSCHFGKKEYLLPIKESALEEIEDDSEEGIE